MTCGRCGLARPQPYGGGFRCGCCGLPSTGLFVPTFPPRGDGWTVGAVVRDGETLKSPGNEQDGIIATVEEL